MTTPEQDEQWAKLSPEQRTAYEEGERRSKERLREAVVHLVEARLAEIAATAEADGSCVNSSETRFAIVQGRDDALARGYPTELVEEAIREHVENGLAKRIGEILTPKGSLDAPKCPECGSKNLCHASDWDECRDCHAAWMLKKEEQS